MKNKNKMFDNNSFHKITTNEVGRGFKYIFI